MSRSFNLSDDESSQSNNRYSAGRTRAPNGRQSGVPPAPPTSYGNQTSTPGPTNGGARPGLGESVGLSDPTLSEARRRKLDAINRLHSLGAQRDIDIPQIVVIGSQSAGKSSLIESISGITLPRASGTCTRCPTECRLVHSNDPWQCTVTLRFMTDESGQLLDMARNVLFGPPIRNPKDVEERLRRAQRAILNPAVDPTDFLDGTHHSPENALNFSTNCVSLEIKGPDVTDLSFCDLPGLIASVSDNGRDEDVEEVKELVSSYIKRESCIILLTVACETDFETQGAYRLAKQHDPEGTRTIGVLTKPDRIPEGEHSGWLKLIKNERSALQNGWYCVKQPSSAELDKGLTFFEARRRGEDFFKTSPWTRLEARYQKRLGTQAVTQKLNEFLMDVISKRVPEIMQELQALLQQTKEQLQALPEPLSNDPVMELMHLVNDFSDDLHRQGDGFSQGISRDVGGNVVRSNQFEAIRRAQEAFRFAIRATVPYFRPYAGSQPHDVDSSDVSVLRTLRASSPTPHFLVAEEGPVPPSSQAPIYLNEVVEKVQKAMTRELPDYFPFHVVQDLISLSTDQWQKPAFKLITEIHQIAIEHQTALITLHFHKYTGGDLYRSVTNIMQEYTQKRRDEAVARTQWLLQLEAHAFTLNKPLLADYKQKFFASYTGVSESAQIYRPWNSNQTALEIIATVRAYFQVAYKRIVDTVPLAIDHELVRVQKKTLRDKLYSGLRITGPQAQEYCKKLLAEPAEVSALREELENRRDRLIAAQKELVDI